jgi:hypothetical protein
VSRSADSPPGGVTTSAPRAHVTVRWSTSWTGARHSCDGIAPGADSPRAA